MSRAWWCSAVAWQHARQVPRGIRQWGAARHKDRQGLKVWERPLHRRDRLWAFCVVALRYMVFDRGVLAFLCCRGSIVCHKLCTGAL